MGIEDGFGKTSGLEQGEAEQNRIAQGGPDGFDDVGFRGNVLHQDGIDADTDHDEKGLKGQGQKGAKIILSHTAPFPVDHGGHGDGSHRRDQIDLDHAAINDQEDADTQGLHSKANEEALKPESKERAQFHGGQPRLKVCHCGGQIHRGVC